MVSVGMTRPTTGVDGLLVGREVHQDLVEESGRPVAAGDVGFTEHVDENRGDRHRRDLGLSERSHEAPTGRLPCGVTGRHDHLADEGIEAAAGVGRHGGRVDADARAARPDGEHRRPGVGQQHTVETESFGRDAGLHGPTPRRVGIRKIQVGEGGAIGEGELALDEVDAVDLLLSLIHI